MFCSSIFVKIRNIVIVKIFAQSSELFQFQENYRDDHLTLSVSENIFLRKLSWKLKKRNFWPKQIISRQSAIIAFCQKLFSQSWGQVCFFCKTILRKSQHLQIFAKISAKIFAKFFNIVPPYPICTGKSQIHNRAEYHHDLKKSFWPMRFQERKPRSPEEPGVPLPVGRNYESNGIFTGKQLGSRIHGRSISLRFLSIILGVLRLEVSVYNVFITNQFQTTFARGE
jgi:hypothetical protein